jgi:hypothetical protein
LVSESNEPVRQTPQETEHFEMRNQRVCMFAK